MVTHDRGYADAQTRTPNAGRVYPCRTEVGQIFRRPPETATTEELRNFQLHLVDQGVPPITLNATITGQKFFFEVTVGHGEVMTKMQSVHVPRTLPVILSCEEIGRLIAADGKGVSRMSERRGKSPDFHPFRGRQTMKFEQFSAFRLSSLPSGKFSMACSDGMDVDPRQMFPSFPPARNHVRRFILRRKGVF